MDVFSPSPRPFVPPSRLLHRHQAAFDGLYDGLGAVLDAEFLEEVIQMILHRLFRNKYFLSDLLIGLPYILTQLLM